MTTTPLRSFAAPSDVLAKVRHVTTRTSSGVEGMVTGIPIYAHRSIDGSWVTVMIGVRMYSAACLHDDHLFPPGVAVVKIERW